MAFERPLRMVESFGGAFERPLEAKMSLGGRSNAFLGPERAWEGVRTPSGNEDGLGEAFERPWKPRTGLRWRSNAPLTSAHLGGD
jgi:hypothetical protein